MLMTILLSVLDYLIAEEKLELSKNADKRKTASDLLQKMPSASFGSHLGSWLGKALIAHEMVEELYASDQELKNVLQEIDFYNRNRE